MFFLSCEARVLARQGDASAANTHKFFCKVSVFLSKRRINGAKSVGMRRWGIPLLTCGGGSVSGIVSCILSQASAFPCMWEIQFLARSVSVPCGKSALPLREVTRKSRMSRAVNRGGFWLLGSPKMPIKERCRGKHVNVFHDIFWVATPTSCGSSAVQKSADFGVRGNGITSRMFCIPVTNRMSRSNPSPKPACGQEPNLRVSRYHE